jgi:hypothetical protein
MCAEKEEQKTVQADERTKPNESSGIYVRGFVKITDPESGQVIVETAN